MKKDHVGSSYSQSIQQCKRTLDSYPDGHKINFTQLAQDSNLHGKENNVPGNAGQIIRAFIESSEIDLSRFILNKSDRYRKKKRTVEGMPLPCDITNDELKKTLMK